MRAYCALGAPALVSLFSMRFWVARRRWWHCACTMKMEIMMNYVKEANKKWNCPHHRENSRNGKVNTHCGAWRMASGRPSERKIAEASHQSWNSCIGARFGQFPANFFPFTKTPFTTIQRTRDCSRANNKRERLSLEFRRKSVEREITLNLSELHPLTWAHHAVRMKLWPACAQFEKYKVEL